MISKAVAMIPLIVAGLVLGMGDARADNDYMVEKGDSLSKIGKLLGVPYEAIMKANGLKNTTIYPDQILRIPSGGRRYETETADPKAASVPIPQTNPTPVIAVPVIATVVKKPKSRPSYSATAYIPPVQGASKSRASQPARLALPTSYTVQSGDSIWSISRKFGLQPWDLRKTNNLNFSPIHEGLVLQLPKRSGLADMASL